MLALIDFDIIIWRCASAAEEVWYDVYCEGELVESFNKKKLADLYVGMDHDFFTVKTRYKPLSKSLAAMFVDNLIESILTNTGATDYKGYIGGKINYRKYICPEYKANRKGLHKPIHSQFLREYLIDKHDAIEVEYIEADDAIAIEQTRCMKEGIPSIICSIDKDMLQVPGLHYNIVNETTQEITEFEGEKNFYKQVLIGDVADNIKGLKGIGPKKAEKILEGCYTAFGLEERAADAYHEHNVSVNEWCDRIDLLYVLRTKEEASERERFVREIEEGEKIESESVGRQ